MQQNTGVNFIGTRAEAKESGERSDWVRWPVLVHSGAAVGAIAASYFVPGGLVFAAGIFLLGLLSASVHADRSAYRFGGITLAIVLLIPRVSPAWRVAFHRSAEVSIGIGVALLLTVVWPEREDTPAGEK